MSNAFSEAWGVLKGTPYTSGRETGTHFNRASYPFRAGSANYMRDPERGTLSPESEAGWTRMQNPTIRSLLQRFAQRGAQNIAASKLPWSQRVGATLPDESSKFVIGGPSQDKGNFPIAPEISLVDEGQVTQFNLDPTKNRRMNPRQARWKRGDKYTGYLEPEMWDERLEDTYGNQLREQKEYTPEGY